MQTEQMKFEALVSSLNSLSLSAEPLYATEPRARQQSRSHKVPAGECTVYNSLAGCGTASNSNHVAEHYQLSNVTLDLATRVPALTCTHGASFNLFRQSLLPFSACKSAAVHHVARPKVCPRATHTPAIDFACRANRKSGP
jgi:hypothetical protein